MKKGIVILCVVGWTSVVVYGVHQVDPGFTARWHWQVLGLSTLVTSLIDWAYGAFLRNQISPLKTSALPTLNAERLAQELQRIDRQFAVIWWISIFLKVLLAVAVVALAHVTSEPARVCWGITGYASFAVSLVLMVLGITIFEAMKRWRLAFETAERMETERRAQLESMRNFPPRHGLDQDQHLHGYTETIHC